VRGLTGSGVGAAPVAGSKQPLLAQVARDLLHDVQSRTWDDWEYLMEAMQELAKDETCQALTLFDLFRQVARHCWYTSTVNPII